MVFVVKILRTGLGFVSEAIHTAKDRSASNDQALYNLPNDCLADKFETPASDQKACADSSLSSSPSEQPHDRNIIEGELHTSHVGRDHSLESVASADQDEVAWQLDDLIECLEQPDSSENSDSLPHSDNLTELHGGPEQDEEEKIKQREALARELLAIAGPAPEELQRLPCPVIIPQRRPRNKDRGFVRAYAPDLDKCGIKQEFFLQFLQYLDTVNRASAWIEVVFIAAQITSSLPFPAAMAVGTVLSVIAGTARELQKRTRSNTFLEMVNRDIFMPRGLFVMVMAFKPDDSEQQGPLGKATNSLKESLFKKEKVDINQAAMKWSDTDSKRSNFGKALDKIRVQSGETKSELELPERASLIYPQLDQIASGTYKEEQSQGIIEKIRDAGQWATDYMDRRAMVFYEKKHPGTPMVVPSEQRKPMKSRFNDPDHPANSGSIISLVTGGLVPLPGPGKLLAKRNEALGINRLFGKPVDSEDGRVIPSTGKYYIKKVFQKNVLYLAVVNLPTEKETEDLKAQFDNMMEQSESNRSDGEPSHAPRPETASELNSDRTLT
ncbi:hypothetical protein N7537_003013 [Penicillium hordei]|uniref:Uncharacterized protein n=1 Tax=Penicillium hordei TaxID=40994 RepID=A0AAD6EIE0_9EURO|nr:uncharacterized protein N7537_003013 [Penicillium hordei]KAJ5617899.1 hypothetical protein N7537_003013 [Penicillium hordei]